MLMEMSHANDINASDGATSVVVVASGVLEAAKKMNSNVVTTKQNTF